MRKMVLALALFLLAASDAAFAQTAPEYFLFRGRLVDKDLKAQQGLFDVRVTFWLGQDANDNQPTSDSGALWKEFHTVEVEPSGRFDLTIGSRKQLPDAFSFETYAYVQVDVRPALSRQYVNLDPHPFDPKRDRINLVRLPYKGKNNGLGRRIGFGSGEIPYLNGQGEFPMSTMPAQLKSTLESLQEDVRVLKEESENSTWQRPVTDLKSLPKRRHARVGEVRYVIDSKELRVFTGIHWEPVDGKKKKDKDSEGSETIEKNSQPFSKLARLHTRRQASPGVFYWDKTNKEYYVGMADGSLAPLFSGKEMPGIVHQDWVDLRFRKLGQLGLKKTNTLTILQHNQRGLVLKSNRENWNEAVAFSDFTIDRSEGKTFEFVFYSGDLKGRTMFGLADADVNVDKLNNQSYKYQQVGLYMQEGRNSNKLYGQREDGRLWYELFESNAQWKPNTFYRTTITINPQQGVDDNIVIAEVDEKDWDNVVKTVVNHRTANTAKAQFLKPFWTTNGNSDYHLSGFRIY